MVLQGWRTAVAVAASAALLAGCGASGAGRQVASARHDATARHDRSAPGDGRRHASAGMGVGAQASDVTLSADTRVTPAAQRLARSIPQARGRIYSLCTAAVEAKLKLHCFSPEALQVAYGVQPLLAQSIDGKGETVVLPEEAIPGSVKIPSHVGPYLRQSILAYDLLYHLPRAHVSFNTKLAPGTPANRALSPEEILDVEMVHAMAPGARIVVQLVTGNLVKRTASVVSHGDKLGQVMSISYGLGETCLKSRLGALQTALTGATTRAVSVFASAGDNLDMSRTCKYARPNGVLSVGLPASDPLVTSVGGTTLSVAPTTGAYVGETVWNQQETLGHGKPEGGGGGFSALFPTPSYQVGVPGIGAMRGDPDVAFDADRASGPAIVEYLEGASCSTNRHLHHNPSKLRCALVQPVGGTSVGSPAWAGIAALADQYAHHALGFLNPALYKIGESPQYTQAFHDVTTGNNTAIFKGKSIPGYSAAAGWDPVAGWGSPDAQVLVPLLAQGG